MTTSSLDDFTTSTCSGARSAGRPKGTTNQMKLETSIRISTAYTKAAMHYADERNKAKQKNMNVPNGFLNGLIKQTEEEFELPCGSLRFATIKKRVERNNLTGFAHQKTSPLHSIEPLIVDYCIRLANMGAPLLGEQVMSLADSLIIGTEVREKFLTYKAKRH